MNIEKELKGLCEYLEDYAHNSDDDIYENAMLYSVDKIKELMDKLKSDNR